MVHQTLIIASHRPSQLHLCYTHSEVVLHSIIKDPLQGERHNHGLGDALTAPLWNASEHTIISRTGPIADHFVVGPRAVFDVFVAELVRILK